MTKLKFVFSMCCLLVSLCLLELQAQETKPAEPLKSRLELVWVVDSNPREFIWRVDKLPLFAFKSLASHTLHDWVTGLPAKSTIEYSPSDALIGGEPADEEVRRFQEFCKTQNVELTVYPAG